MTLATFEIKIFRFLDCQICMKLYNALLKGYTLKNVSSLNVFRVYLLHFKVLLNFFVSIFKLSIYQSSFLKSIEVQTHDPHDPRIWLSLVFLTKSLDSHSLKLSLLPEIRCNFYLSNCHLHLSSTKSICLICTSLTCLLKFVFRFIII